LLDGGATVPFVARYRKEATGTLDDAQLRTLEERLGYLRELDERRAVILASIGEQGKLDAALKQAIEAADSKARLEDLYLPYRPKRRTKAQTRSRMPGSIHCRHAAGSRSGSAAMPT
jgi:protein Tex